MPEPGGGGERVVAEKRRGEIDDRVSLSPHQIQSVFTQSSQFKKRIAKDKLAGFVICAICGGMLRRRACALARPLPGRGLRKHRKARCV